MSPRMLGRSRTLRAACAAITAVAAVVAFAACTGDRTVDAPGSIGELRAATDDDVFAEPAEQHYRIVSVDVASPDLGVLGASGAIRPEGSLTLSDGEITEADMTIASGLHGKSVSFSLTEPLVLRRDNESAEPVDAVGTLRIGGIEHHRTTVEVIPSFEGDGTATLDLEIPVPASLSAAPLFSDGAIDSVRATVRLAADSPPSGEDGPADPDESAEE
ncbi:hypothetical protein [Leucobacter sp. GX24907]